MSSWSEGRRPLTLAILALGGEGGGVLADWIVATAERAGHHAQTTSVAGVAQRTGATVYYVELFPSQPSAESPTADARAPVRDEPVMGVFPTPGEVDVVIASELMECGRAVQRGFSTADRTTLITSTNRVYSIDEKVAMGDGRVDDAALLDAARNASKRLVAADFMQLAEQAGSVISASLFGGLAGSGALPFAREQFEASIRVSGKAVDASLAAFAAGFEAATADATPSPSSSAAKLIELPIAPGAASSRSTEERKAHEEAERTAIAATDPASLVGPELRDLAERVGDLPPAARSTILHGLVRTAVYQDHAYAERYLERVARFADVDPERAGDARLTREAARHVALWMCYQDTIQVATQKVRRKRMERIRDESHVRPGQLVQVREFLHPQAEEIVDTMPTWLGGRLARSRAFERVVHAATHRGMILNTSSVVGYTLLTTMARARPLRPRSVRFVREQAAIERWLALALDVARTDAALACEIVECQRVLKGYGSTYAHGGESFATLMDAADALVGAEAAATRMADLRDAALADEDGAALRTKIHDTGAAESPWRSPASPT
ncbi:indolepyruvate oxidoreductase subunit beta family protein [Conexibacter woesei]|uniref:Putative indolepyruvate oxidoreductase subunit B n=1 Tax=Conexibacter woesei (strain DSM 14684 / CCUG 47730 / CIP 108061 / JCM 11494 / NBRC 100937 / ID131577) TaxID=469383 RepID=D3F5A6_CONWI|nr:indolepyruvate oxidoreductase subunit beta family protein [Conexibacter woesei]ADB50573.1 putative indolepyruvate oxidoreductase subunit B [Conexibacter woesei DSM 14684]